MDFLTPLFGSPFRRRSHLWAAGVGLWGGTAMGASAQEAAAPAKSWFTIVYTDGGVLMYPLTACSVAVIALAIYNLMALKRERFINTDLVDHLNGQMGELRVRSAIETASHSPTYFGRMVATALPEMDATETETLGSEKVEESMADFAMQENRGFMQWIGYFSLLAQISPMLGLLGTVQGMIGAFANLEQNRQNPGLLAGYISIALYTTAAGLIIAIPAILCFFYFKNKLNERVSECLLAARQLLRTSVTAVHPERATHRVPEGFSDIGRA
jgi:biopolymer transport protein ExbB